MNSYYQFRNSRTIYKVVTIDTMIIGGRLENALLLENLITGEKVRRTEAYVAHIATRLTKEEAYLAVLAEI